MHLRSGKNTTQYKEHDENIIMFFDTETNGSFKEPYIIELAFILYDKYKKQIIETYSEYVRIPDTVIMYDDAVKLHKITRETLNEKGIPIEDVLYKFYCSYMKCSTIVAHNIQFDIRMVRTELERNKQVLIEKGYKNMDIIFNKEYQLNNNIKNECTMLMGTNFCDIKVLSNRVDINGNRIVYKKRPKLRELKEKLKIEGVFVEHEARSDVEVCKLCYERME